MRTQTAATDSLNTKLLLKTLVAFKKGDFSVRLPGEWTGEAGKIADELEKINRKLGNEKFVANAKPEIVAAERERLAELEAAAGKIETAIRRVRDVE